LELRRVSVLSTYSFFYTLPTLFYFLQTSCELSNDEPDLIDEFSRIQKALLGKEELIKPTRAQKVNGQWEGGIEWERYDGLVGIKGSRCNTLGPSNQCSRSLVSPSASAKVMDFELDDHQKLQRDMIKV
jgi:hypothetical protein